MKEQRWHLTEIVQKIQEDMKKLVKGFSDGDIAAYAMGMWVPAADVVETAEEVHVIVELPGVAAEAVDVSLTGNELKVHGTPPGRGDQESGRFHLAERRHGPFSRTFVLPATVDPQQVRAKVNGGLLEITFDKKPESRAQQIKVEVK